MAGVVCHKKQGDSVEEGETILELHVDDPGKLHGALGALEGAFSIEREPAEPRPLIIERIA